MDQKPEEKKDHHEEHHEHNHKGHSHEEGAHCCSEAKSQANLLFMKFDINDWSVYNTGYPMFSAKQLDQISDTVGTMTMPEVFYGFNRLYFINPTKDFLLEFAPVEALSLAAYAKRNALYKTSDKSEKDLSEQLAALSLEEDDVHLNQIDIVPEKIEVKEAQHWKKKDMSQVKDFKHLEVISDWTYSTPYKGNIRYLSKHTDKIRKETALELKSEGKSTIKIEKTEQGIPFERLGQDNPIVHFGEVYLYEDDLGDQGYTCCKIRFRVMKDCFYVLLRYYLRVDEVLVRIYDTRIFHSYDTNYLLREFQYKECTYDQLRAKEFKLNSDWSLSKNQSDEVFPHLDLKHKTLDKVTIE